MIALPRPYVENPKSGSFQEDSYMSAMMKFKSAAEAEAYATAESNPEYSEIDKYLNYIEGRQWRSTLPAYRSTYRDNRVARARVEAIGQLTDIRPTIDIRSSVKGYEQQADILQRVVHAEWRRNEMDLTLGSVIDHSLFGTGYWKIGATMPGNLLVTSWGADSVFPIQQTGNTLQTSSMVMFKTFRPIEWFKVRFGKRADGIEEEIDTFGSIGGSGNSYARPGFLPQYSWDTLSPAMQYHMGRKQSAPSARIGHSGFPVVQLLEFWIEDYTTNPYEQEVLVKDPNLSVKEHNYWYFAKPGERLYPRKRLIIFGGNRLLYDGPSPYWHGLYPFERLCLNPMVWAPGGLSLYRDLIEIQKGINEVGAGTLDVVRRAINPQLISKQGSVHDTAWSKFQPDKPGGKLLTSPMSDPSTAVRYVDPPNLPAYVGAFSTYLLQAFREQAGNMDVRALTGKKQQASGDTIEKLQDLLSIPLRLQSRYIEAFLRATGIHAISHVFQFFTAERRMTLLGKDGVTLEDFDYDPTKMMVPASKQRESHHKTFSFEIAEGSLHGASRDRNKSQAIVLFKLHAISLQELYRQLELGDPGRIISEMADEAKLLQSAQSQLAGGRSPRTQKEKKQGSS